MNGKYIFDTRSRYIGTIEKAGREARKMKYRFLLFNDAVYYVDDDGKTFVRLQTARSRPQRSMRMRTSGSYWTWDQRTKDML